MTPTQGPRNVKLLLGNGLENMEIKPNFENCKSISSLETNRNVNLPPDFTFYDIREYCNFLCDPTKKEYQIVRWIFDFDRMNAEPTPPEPTPTYPKSCFIKGRNPNITNGRVDRLIELYIIKLPKNWQNENWQNEKLKDNLWHGKLIEYSITSPIHIGVTEFASKFLTYGRHRELYLFKTRDVIDLDLPMDLKSGAYLSGDYLIPTWGRPTVYNVGDFLRGKGYNKDEHIFMCREWNLELFKQFVVPKGIDPKIVSDESLLWVAHELDIKYNEGKTTRKQLWNLCKREIESRFFDPCLKLRMLLLCSWCFGRDDSIFNNRIMPAKILIEIISYLKKKVFVDC